MPKNYKGLAGWQNGGWIIPRERSPIVIPRERCPIVIPRERSPIVIPWERSPIVIPRERSPMVIPRERSDRGIYGPGNKPLPFRATKRSVLLCLQIPRFASE